MLHLFPLFPGLFHLELGLNCIQGLSDGLSAHKSTKLCTLNLQENKLHDWRAILQGLADFKQ